MGAIAIHLGRSRPASSEVVERMLRAAPHRGSHTEGVTRRRAAFGIVTDPDWKTASIAATHDRLAAFCGALDNQSELAARIRAARSANFEDTPAGVLLAGFVQWGDEFVRQLRGSFAGAVTDGETVWLFRDQFGARPLFQHDGSAGFFCATEVKQVLAGADIPREPNLEFLRDNVFGGLNMGTAFAGITRVPKRSIVEAGPTPGTRARVYWDPTSLVESRRIGSTDAMEGTVEALDRAVRRQLTGHDVLLLSGGLDSPALAVFAARARGLEHPVRALTSIYPDHPSVDELEWTTMAADHVGMPLSTFAAQAGSLDDVERWTALLDGPVSTVSIPETAEAYLEARKYGARTVLNGEVAEFIFEGRRFLLEHLLFRLRLRAAAQVLGFSRKRGRSRSKVARDLLRTLAPVRLVDARQRRRPYSNRAIPPWIDAGRVRWAQPNLPVPSRSILGQSRWIKGQTIALRGEGGGIDVDEICAAVCGVDPRRPFADVDLWEFVLSLPAEVKFSTDQTKPLLRESMRGLLPEQLIDRRHKTVFNEFHVAKADYPALRKYLVGSNHRLEGVDYAVLADRLQAGDMKARELQWARDVARVHVFLKQWD